MVSLGPDLYFIGAEGIYLLECYDYECFWTQMKQKLDTYRANFVAFGIPDTLANCNWIQKVSKMYLLLKIDWLKWLISRNISSSIKVQIKTDIWTEFHLHNILTRGARNAFSFPIFHWVKIADQKWFTHVLHCSLNELVH